MYSEGIPENEEVVEVAKAILRGRSHDRFGSDGSGTGFVQGHFLEEDVFRASCHSYTIFSF
jgi:hypothetical protein